MCSAMSLLTRKRISHDPLGSSNSALTTRTLVLALDGQVRRARSKRTWAASILGKTLNVQKASCKSYYSYTVNCYLIHLEFVLVGEAFLHLPKLIIEGAFSYDSKIF